MAAISVPRVRTTVRTARSARLNPCLCCSHWCATAMGESRWRCGRATPSHRRIHRTLRRRGPSPAQPTAQCHTVQHAHSMTCSVQHSTCLHVRQPLDNAHALCCHPLELSNGVVAVWVHGRGRQQCVREPTRKFDHVVIRDVEARLEVVDGSVVVVPVEGEYKPACMSRGAWSEQAGAGRGALAGIPKR
jgi:hypothetical protein